MRKETEVTMQLNIINKAKTAGITLFALGCAVFLSASPVPAQETSVADHYIVKGATPSNSGSGYAAVNANGTAVYNSQGQKTYYNSVTSSDGKEYHVRRLETNNSVAYKPQTSGEKLSSAFSYEVKRGEKALSDAASNLMSGNFGDAASGLLGYARSTTGDILGGAIDVAKDINGKAWDVVDSGLDFVSDIPVVGWVSDHTLKPLANVGRFVGDTALNVLDFGKNLLFGESNLECRQEKMDNIYKSGCYPCKVVKSLISAFLNGSQFLSDISKEAGQKLLILGFFLWLAYYIMQQVSSFKNIEPMAMINDLLIMAFKVLGAWVVISQGFELVVDFVIVPFISWGVDFGTYLLTASTSATGLDISGTQVDTSYLLTGKVGMLPGKFLNDIMTYVAAVDGTVTNHMKLGHMITCHSTHAGAWNVGIIIPNLWIWLCGAAIWFFGFMMTLSILYYLIDMSFKLSFALIALPIVTGLWPFGVTRDKFGACIKIVLNAAGIFVFLAMTTAVGLVLVDSAIMAGMIAEQSGNISPEAIMQPMERNQGILELYQAIEDGDNEKVSDTFMLWGSGFILILFAYLYAIKIIGSTLSDYVDKFFPDEVLGESSPMHSELTRATDMVKQKAMEPVNFAKDVVKFQSAKGMRSVANKFFNKNNDDDEDDGGDLSDKAEKFDKKLDNLQKGQVGETEAQNTKKSKAEQIKGMTNLEAKDDKKMEDATNGTGDKDSGSGAAQALDAAGDGLSETGQAIKEQSKAAADGMRQAGNAADAAGTAAAIPTVGTSKVAGTATKATTEASAAAIETTGKIAGETLKQTGKALKKTAKVVKNVEKAAKRIQKASKKVSKTAQKAMRNIEQRMNQGSNNNSDENHGQSNGSGQNQDNDLIKSMASTASGNANKK